MLLGLDLGTNALKAGLFDAQGHTRHVMRRAYPLVRTHDGGAEQDPEAWWSAVCDAIGELRLTAAEPIEAICAIGQGPTLVVCGDDLKARAPALVWADQRDHGERRRLSAHLGYEVSTYSLLPKISWLAAHNPAIFEGNAQVTQAYDFVASRLMGRCFASQFGPWPPFDGDEFVQAGLDAAWIPPLAAMGSAVGVTQKPWCAEARLPEGVPVFAGVYDAIATTLGVALIEVGRACDYGGGSGGYGVCWGQALEAEGIGWWPGLANNQFIAGGATASAGMTIDWLARMLGETPDLNGSLDRAACVDPGANGLLFLPYVMGERAPLWNDQLRGALIGLTLSHGRQHIVRAALEGVALGLRNIARVVGEAGGTMREMRVCGGTARYDLLNHIKADVLGVPVLVPRVLEASLLGAAMIAAVGAGMHADYTTAARAMVHIANRIAPNPDNHRRYDAVFDNFRQLTALKLS
jgi:xylulokinase